MVVEVVTGVAKVQVPAPTRVADTLVWPGTKGTPVCRVPLVRLEVPWKNFLSTISSMTRLSLRCTLFPSLSKMPTFSTTSLLARTVQLLCGRQLSSRLAGITTFRSAVGVLTTSPGATFWSTSSTTPLPGLPPPITLARLVSRAPSWAGTTRLWLGEGSFLIFKYVFLKQVQCV